MLLCVTRIRLGGLLLIYYPSQHHRPISVIVYSASMAKLSFCIYSSKSIPHSYHDLRTNIHTMMAGENPLCRQNRDFLQRVQIALWISRRIIGKQGAFIYQVTGKEISFLCFPKNKGVPENVPVCETLGSFFLPNQWCHHLSAHGAVCLGRFHIY